VKRPLTTTEDQSTTFIELFFDLVFVYAVTQTVSLVHQELSGAGVARAVIVFWLVWWAWTQFTWALNSADTTHPAVEAVVLVATAFAFLMAVTIPDAFGDAGGWFAATYIAVRVVGLALYGRVAWDEVAKRAAVRRFALLSVGGLAAVASGGVVEGDARGWWWAAAVLLDGSPPWRPEPPKAGTSAPTTSASGTGCSSSSPWASRSSWPAPGSPAPNQPPRPWRWPSWRWR
jgi:low temperature requirement protein LtrA